MKSWVEMMAEVYAEEKGNGIGDWFDRKADYEAGARALKDECIARLNQRYKETGHRVLLESDLEYFFEAKE